MQRDYGFSQSADVLPRHRAHAVIHLDPTLAAGHACMTTLSDASDYAVVGHLGHGSFGDVFKARHLQSGRLVAHKRVFVRSASEERIPEVLIRELKSMQLLRHRNVLPLYDVLCQSASLVLVTQLCVTDLGHLIRTAPTRLPESLVKGIAQQLLQGVAAVHAAGCLHRDLKPGNVLIARDGTLKLADFGLARLHSLGSLTPTVATRWYRAPELLFGAAVYGSGVDLWAAGCILGELLGLAPLAGGDSDIDQLGRVLRLRGSVNEAAWPEARDLPDYHKISFPETKGQALEELLPDAPALAVRLLDALLAYNPQRRPAAEEALLHDWFFSDPAPCDERAVAAYTQELLRKG